jgi:pyruvate/2-oxoglutarate/acetoin dehydrogenase E1 component
MPELFYSHAIRQALEEEMERDPRVILLGEDIAGYGGAFKLSAGIADRFGTERVRNTPISEGGFVGVAVGAALTGLRPVVEIMFMDFITLAMDQLVNHAAKFRYQFGEQARVPLVLRTPAGAGRGYGPTHSQSLERWLVATPGLVVLAPATAADARGLLKSAIRCDDPVVFLESKVLYGRRGEVPEGDVTVPIGEAAVVREGEHITLVAYSRMVEEALRAAQALEPHGVSAEVIDLRTLAPMDTETVAASVEKTGRVVVVEEGWLTGGIGAEVVARIVESSFDYLNAPPARVAALDVPVPASRTLEQAATPDWQDIARAAARLMQQYK